MRIGSLFSGAGGLDMAVQAVFGGEVVWHSEIDKAASKVLAYRFPGVPNLGDITQVDWADVPAVDVLCGGFPCQDQRGFDAALGGDGHAAVAFSGGAAVGQQPGGASGAEAGAHPSDGSGDHRGERADGLALLPTPTQSDGTGGGIRTGLSWEGTTKSTGDGGNSRLRDVAGLLGPLLPTPRSSDCFGAGQHGDGGLDLRTTISLLPTPNAQDGNGGGRYSGKPGSGHQSTLPGEARLLCTPSASDGAGGKTSRSGGWIDEPLLGVQAALLPTPKAHDGEFGTPRTNGRPIEKSTHLGTIASLEYTSHWGKYAPAIARWEQIVGPAPAPTEPNKNGNPRLSAAFSEWLMGWPQGWVTHPDIGISRNDQLRIVGNGVCPQQAIAALRYLLTVSEVAA